MPNGPAKDAPQHVAATLIGGKHAVGQEEGDCAGVIGENAKRRGRHFVRDHAAAALPAMHLDARARLVALAAPVLESNHAVDALDERQKQVGVVHRRFALHDPGDALEAGAGIDRRLRKRHQRAVCLPVVLHEHEIPELEKPVAFRPLDERVERELAAIQLRPFSRRAGGHTPPWNHVREIHEDLGARTTRPGVRHLPEVVLVAETVDPRVGQTGNLALELTRLVVGMMHGDA